MKTIEKMLISQDEIDRIYTGELTLYLWRALHKNANVMKYLMDNCAYGSLFKRKNDGFDERLSGRLKNRQFCAVFLPCLDEKINPSFNTCE